MNVCYTIDIYANTERTKIHESSTAFIVMTSTEATPITSYQLRPV